MVPKPFFSGAAAAADLNSFPVAIKSFAPLVTYLNSSVALGDSLVALNALGSLGWPGVAGSAATPCLC